MSDVYVQFLKQRKDPLADPISVSESYLSWLQNQVEDLQEKNKSLEKQLEENYKAFDTLNKLHDKSITELQKLRELLSGLVDDFKYYISEQNEPPQRAGYLKEAENELNQSKDEELH